MPDPPAAVQVSISNPRVPIFSGKDTENCDLHWLLFQDYVTENNIANDQQVAKFRITLNSEAREWYELHKAELVNAATLERLFKAAFAQQISRSQLLKQFNTMSLNPGETIPAYSKRLKTLATKAKINDTEMLVSQFVEGLPESIRPMVKARRDETLEDATLTAQAVHSDAPPIPTGATAFSMKKTDDAELSELITQQMKALFVANRPYQRSDSRDRGRDHGRDRGRDRGRPNYQSSRYPNNNRRSVSRDSSRSQSRGRDRYERRPTPRRQSSGERRVSFNDRAASKSRSPSPISCYFCKKGHRYSECSQLRRALRDGKIHTQNF